MTRSPSSPPLTAPPPGDAAIDATGSDGRAVLAVREFASCAPEDADRDKFMAASQLLDQGEAPHDVPPALIAQKTGR